MMNKKRKKALEHLSIQVKEACNILKEYPGHDTSSIIKELLHEVNTHDLECNFKEQDIYIDTYRNRMLKNINEESERRLRELNEELSKIREEGLKEIQRLHNDVKKSCSKKLHESQRLNKEHIRKSVRKYYEDVMRRWNINLINLANDAAKTFGGKCISTECLTQKDILIWQCGQNHVFESPLNKILSRTKVFCKDCTQNHPTENYVRLIFECIFGEKFPTSYPKWLINPETSKIMELDGYCEKLNIAFEYNGPHHTTLIHNNSEEDLIKQITKDKNKNTICNDNNVVLINISFKVHRLKLKKQIINECFYLHSKGIIKIPKYVQGKIPFDQSKYIDGLKQIRAMMLIHNEFDDLWNMEGLAPYSRI